MGRAHGWLASHAQAALIGHCLPEVMRGAMCRLMT